MDIAAVVTIVSGIISVAAIISSPINTWICCHYDKQLQQTERFFKARSSTYPPYIEAVSLYLRHPAAEQHTQTERAAAAGGQKGRRSHYEGTGRAGGGPGSFRAL